MKKYLVLGGEGFIGSYLVTFLRDRGYQVESIDFKSNRKMDLRYIEIDNLESFDGCFFLAWNVGGAKYLSQKDTWISQYQDNVSLINNILPQLHKSKIPFLFVSSQLAGSDYSPYSVTKLLGERYAHQLDNAVVARQWNAYGMLEESNIKSHVISDMVQQAVTSKTINLITTGNEERKFLHLEDICEAYLHLIRNHIGKIFDVTASESRKIIDIAKLIAERTNAEVIPGNSNGFNPKVIESNCIPNWTPQVEFIDGIERMISQAYRRYKF